MKNLNEKSKKAVAAVIFTVCLCVLSAIAVTTITIPHAKKYAAAIALYNAGNYEEALVSFHALGDYKDSQSKMQECKFASQLTDLDTEKTLNFGFYEQDNDSSNGKEEIEWIVLKVEESRALLISKYALDFKQYFTPSDDESSGVVTWKNCTLRSWLNEDFLSSAFSRNQQNSILAQNLLPDKNLNNEAESENETVDKVFCLSSAEAEQYADIINSFCSPTKYAIARLKTNAAYPQCDWWLRTIGTIQNTAGVVNNRYGGSFDTNDAPVDSFMAVRPAIWISLEMNSNILQ